MLGSNSIWHRFRLRFDAGFEFSLTLRNVLKLIEIVPFWSACHFYANYIIQCHLFLQAQFITLMWRQSSYSIYDMMVNYSYCLIISTQLLVIAAISIITYEKSTYSVLFSTNLKLRLFAIHFRNTFAPFSCRG